MLPTLTHIYRTWLEVDPIGDLPGLAVPVYAKPSKTKLAGHVLTVELNPCPERDALLKGRRFEVSGMPFVGMFEAVGGPGLLTLRPSGTGYTLEASDLTSATLVAYSLPKSVDGQQVHATEATIGTGPNSIQVFPDTGKGATAKCSADLYDRALRVRVQYAQAIVTTEAPLGQITAHLLARQGDTVVYARLAGCECTAVAKVLSLTVDPDRVSVDVLTMEA
jgi:hypothetical protein